MNARDQLRQNIRDLREDKRLTQAAMAEKLGMSETGYAKIERGESGVKIDRLRQIAQVLEVNIVDLIPFGDDVITLSNSNDNFSNSNNFNLSLEPPALEAEILNLRNMIAMKNELLDGRDREIAALQQQIWALKELVSSLKE
ncbi:MAG: helix-turn-helix transcriptional regulator [Neisseria sp.]|jgi:hypothetical protein|nr:helix-turn-helix transcriptional regulator [Neisseria sp.]